MASDAAETVLTLLQESGAEGAEAIRDLLVAGANSIVEAWDYDDAQLTAAEEARRDFPEDEQAVALLLSVEDLGDDPDAKVTGLAVEYVGLRILDRGRGYTNIRLVREAILAWLFSNEAWRDSDFDRGLLELEYGGRSGQAYSSAHDVQLEAITVRARVARQF